MKQPLERPMKQPLERPQEWPMKQPLEWPMKQPLERPSHFAPPSRSACIAPCLGRGLRGLRSGANTAILLLSVLFPPLSPSNVFLMSLTI